MDRRRAGATSRRWATRPAFGRVLHIRGSSPRCAANVGPRRQRMEASLEIRREVGDAGGAGALLSNLAIVAEYEGDYERSRALHEEGLALRVEAGDTAAIAISTMNLGVMLATRRADGGGPRAPGGEPATAPRDRRPADDRPRRAQPRPPHALAGRLRRDARALRRSAPRPRAIRATSGRSRSCSRTSRCSRPSSGSHDLALRLAGAGWCASRRDRRHTGQSLHRRSSTSSCTRPATRSVGSQADVSRKDGLLAAGRRRSSRRSRSARAPR